MKVFFECIDGCSFEIVAEALKLRSDLPEVFIFGSQAYIRVSDEPIKYKEVSTRSVSGIEIAVGVARGLIEFPVISKVS